jgi:hypothetical protein
MTSESRDLWKDHNSPSQPGCLLFTHPRSERPEARHLDWDRPVHAKGEVLGRRYVTDAPRARYRSTRPSRSTTRPNFLEGGADPPYGDVDLTDALDVRELER